MLKWKYEEMNESDGMKMTEIKQKEYELQK